MLGAHQYADEAAPHSDTPRFTPLLLLLLTAPLLPSALVSTHTQAGGPGLTSVRFCPLASSLLDCYSSSQHTEMHTQTDTHTHAQGLPSFPGAGEVFESLCISIVHTSLRPVCPAVCLHFCVRLPVCERLYIKS